MAYNSGMWVSSHICMLASSSTLIIPLLRTRSTNSSVQLSVSPSYQDCKHDEVVGRIRRIIHLKERNPVPHSPKICLVQNKPCLTRMLLHATEDQELAAESSMWSKVPWILQNVYSRSTCFCTWSWAHSNRLCYIGQKFRRFSKIEIASGK
jgi:hypothetical protein